MNLRKLELTAFQSLCCNFNCHWTWTLLIKCLDHDSIITKRPQIGQYKLPSTGIVIFIECILKRSDGCKIVASRSCKSVRN